MRIVLAQINPTVGDLAGNARQIKQWIKKAEDSGADIVVFSELAVTGYPPEDLLLKPRFVADNLAVLRSIAKNCPKNITAIVGFVDSDNFVQIQGKGKLLNRNKQLLNRVKQSAPGLYNAAGVLCGGKIVGVYHKMLLPNYGVFDEKRYFKPGTRPFVFSCRGQTSANLQRSDLCKFGVSICEDVWFKEGPVKDEAKLGAKIIFSLNASPYHAGKIKERERVVCDRAKESKVWLVYVNMVGGQDELVFDGQSMVVDPRGEVVARAKAFKEELLLFDIDVNKKPAVGADSLGTADSSGTLELSSISMIANQKTLSRSNDKKPWTARELHPSAPGRQLQSRDYPPPTANPLYQNSNRGQLLSLEEEVYRALVLGLRDYVLKNGFQKVVIGLSGGIDSSLVAVIAVDALGEKNVVGVAMPSRFSSKESLEDARKLAKNLGIKLLTIPIEAPFVAYLQTLKPQFRGKKPDVTEENLQARIRGNILMALSNKFGWLVLTTGNKSEMSVGYATLYGDMAGGFAVIKDVPKTLVYKLAEWRNNFPEVRPRKNSRGLTSGMTAGVLKKPPSAELRPGQKDTDSLPPYDILDPILKAYVEEDKSIGEIVKMGFPEKTVRKVALMVDRNEYKRRQAPPGIKITPKAFGRDRRMPITNRYAIGNPKL